MLFCWICTHNACRSPEVSPCTHKPDVRGVRRAYCAVGKRLFKMPIDINLLRVERGGDPEKVRESQRRRFASVELVDKVISIDEKWRRLTGK